MFTKRKLSLVVIYMMVSSFALAQTLTQPGTIEIGGDISFSSQSVTSNSASGNFAVSSASVNRFAFNPYLGFMVSSGFELGLMPGIATVNAGGGASTELNLFFAPSYNINTNGSVYPYFEFLVGYNSINDNYSYGSNTRLREGLGIGLDAGLKVKVKGNSLLLLKIQYLSQTYHQAGYAAASYFGSTINVPPTEYTLSTVSFGMGFRIFIEPKEKKK